MWCDKRKCSDVWCGLIEQKWCICFESDKSSDQYLSTLEDVTEGRTEELNCETWALLLYEQRSSYNSRFLYKIQWTSKFTNNQGITVTDTCIIVSIFVHICIHYFRGCYTRFGAYLNYIRIKCLQKQLVNVFKEKKERKNTAQIDRG
jgi:hypothetical protein